MVQTGPRWSGESSVHSSKVSLYGPLERNRLVMLQGRFAELTAGLLKIHHNKSSALIMMPCDGVFLRKGQPDTIETHNMGVYMDIFVSCNTHMYHAIHTCIARERERKQKLMHACIYIHKHTSVPENTE